MGRRACTFKQTDLTRALKAARAAGVKMKVEITAGKMTLVPVEDEADNGKQIAENDVERWLKKHAHRG
jgi:hypothetical protein